MRTVKKPQDAWVRALNMAGQRAKLIRIPSTKSNYFFTGLLMADGAWVAWPDNLNDQEMKLYIDMYGNIPDLFELKPEQAECTLIRMSNDNE